MPSPGPGPILTGESSNVVVVKKQDSFVPCGVGLSPLVFRKSRSMAPLLALFTSASFAFVLASERGTAPRLQILSVESREVTAIRSIVVKEVGSKKPHKKSSSSGTHNMTLPFAPFYTMSFYNKALYANGHGYGFMQWHTGNPRPHWVPSSMRGRHPAWLKVAALQYWARHGNTSAVLILDTDVLVATVESVDHILDGMDAKGCIMSLSECGFGYDCNTGMTFLKPGPLAVEMVEAWWDAVESNSTMCGRKKCFHFGRHRLWEQDVFNRFLMPKFRKSICATQGPFVDKSGVDIFKHFSMGRVLDKIREMGGSELDQQNYHWREFARSSLTTEFMTMLAPMSANLVSRATVMPSGHSHDFKLNPVIGG